MIVRARQEKKIWVQIDNDPRKWAEVPKKEALKNSGLDGIQTRAFAITNWATKPQNLQRGLKLRYSNFRGSMLYTKLQKTL